MLFLRRSNFVSFLVTCAIASAFANSVAADIVIDSGAFGMRNAATGSFVAASSTFDLTEDDIPHIELEIDFAFIDDGAAVNVNGFVLFAAPELSQFGPMEFVSIVGVQPNDIENPWNANSNGLPRLSVFSDAAGTLFSGSVTESAASTVNYQPIFTVANLQSLLQSGSNTIEIINLNGFQGAAIQGEYSVVSQLKVPEPGITFLLAGVVTVIASHRRDRQI